MEPYDDEDQKYYDAVDQEYAALRLNAYSLNETQPSEKAARALELAQKKGLPRVAIESDLEGYEAEDEYERLKQLGVTAPKLYKWLSQTPDNYAVAKDDADSLSQLETTLKKIPPTKPQYALGTYNITPAVEMFKGAFADPKKAAAQVGDMGRSVFSALPKEMGGISSGLGAWLDSAITFTEKNIYGNIPVVNRGVQEAIDWERRFFARHPEVAKAITPYAGPSAILKTYGAEGKKIQQAWQPADMGFEDKVAQGLGQMVVQVGLALATGGTSMGAAISTGSFMAMGADQQAEALKAAGLNPDEYFGQLSAGAAITGSAEMMRLNSIMKILPPAMRDRVTKSVVSRIAGQAFEEGAQEAIEGVLHNVVTMSYDPRATVLGGVAEAGAVGGTVGGLFQGLIELLTPGRMRGGTGVQLDKLMADLAREETEIAESADEKALAETIARVGQMKLTGLSPEKAAEVIGRVTEGTGVETVTVDLDGAVEALQQAGLDPVEALASLGVTEEQLGQRFERFGEIEVSTATLLTSPLMRDNASIVTPHLRTGADSVTPAKKEALREEFQAQVKERVAEIEEALAGGRELADKEQAVLDRVTERLSASGMFPERRILDAQAAVQAATVNTFAARLGVDPVEFYEQHFPKVQGSIDGMVMEENALEQDLTERRMRQEVIALEGERASLRAEAQSIEDTVEMGQPYTQEQRDRFGAIDTRLEEIERTTQDAYKRYSELGYDPSTALAEDIGLVRFTKKPLDQITAEDVAEYDRAMGGTPAPSSAKVISFSGALRARDKRGQDTLAQARTEGYEGEDRGEAASWLAAKRKGLDMSVEGVKARAKEMGYDTETVLYHGTGEDFDVFVPSKGGVYGPGVYLTNNPANAHWYGKQNAKIMPVYIKGNLATDRQYSLALASTKEDPVAAADLLKKQGFAGIKNADTVTVFDPSNIRSVNAAFDPDNAGSAQLLAQERRGQFSPDTNTVTLFEQSDVTTMLHEGAHWYLDLVEKMAKAPDPHPFVVEQYQAVQKWYEGVKNTPALKAARLNYRIQQQGSSFVLYEKDGAKEKLRGRFASQAEAEVRIDWIEMHETWAETFEVYVYTGKAPSEALRSTFIAFKDWITKLWKRMYGNGQPARANLNPEVIAIMDRMLAVDEEIDAAVADVFIPFEAQAKALRAQGVLTQKEYERALANMDDAREQAKEDFGARVMADKMREDEAWWNTEKRRVRGDVVREIDRSKPGRAHSWLGYGTWKGDVPTSEAPGDGEGEFFQKGEQISEAQAVASREFDDEANRIIEGSEFRYDMLDEELARLTADIDAKLAELEDRDNIRLAEEVRDAYSDPRIEALDPDSETYDADFDAIEAEAQRIYDEEYERLEDARIAEEEALEDQKLAREDTETQRLEEEAEAQIEAFRKQAITELVDRFEQAYGAKALLSTSYPDYMEFDTKTRYAMDRNGTLRPLEDFVEDNSLGQSIRAATRMPMPEVDAWVRDKVSANVQTFQNGDESMMMTWPLTDDPDAPQVLMSIRLNRNGRADVNLFLDNKMADALENVEDMNERRVLATEMFSQAVMVMRQYASETPDLKAFNFIAAESKATPTKTKVTRSKATESKSREELYRLLLSTLKLEGYTAYEVSGQMSVVREQDGGKIADPLFSPGAKFVLIKDGVPVEQFARTEILRGSQRGGDAGEVVTALKAVQLTRPARGGVDRGGREIGGPDTGGAVDNSLGQEAPASPFYSQLQRVIERSATTRAPASQWLGIIRNAPGVKAEEVEWTGVQEYLEAQDGPVTREALAAFLAGNGVQVEEVMKQAPIPDPQSEFASGPIGQIVRDVLRRGITDRDDLEMTLANERNFYNGMAKNFPEYYEEKEADATALAEMVVEDLFPSYPRGDGLRGTQFEEHTLPGGQNYKELLLTLPKVRGPETHWDRDENVVAHARFKERAGPNGERVLALEEIQSDWHQKGREDGYEQPVDPVAAEETRVAKELAMRNRTTAGNSVISFITEMEKPDLEEFVERLYAAVGPDADTRRDVVETIYATADLRSLSEQKRQMIERRGALILTNMVKEGSLSEEAKAGAAAALDNLAQAALRYREAEQAYMNAAYPGGIPNAPFKNNAWAELVLKRMIRWAADNGFDSVAWIPGNIQNGQVVEDTGDNRGDFYDKILPNIANKLGKKYGARAAPQSIDMPAQARGTGWEDTGMPRQAREAGAVQWWTLPLTDALRTAAISEGFPLFQPGDPKGWGETAPPPNLPPMRLNLAETERLYGKEAVAKLPKAIRDRGRDQTSIDSMFAIARATAKTLRRKPPKSLFQFIRSRKARTVEGKTVPVKQWGIRGAADELKAMDRADLINEENGIHIDYMRELAEEAGYLPEGSTVNDMLNAIDREARGEPVYSSQDQNEVLDYQNAEEWANWFDEQGVDITDKDEKALRAKLAKVVTSTAADAVTPDQAAERLGFNTGEELLAALAEIGNRERFIREETDRRMAAEFGDPYNDGTFAEAARQAAEIEVKARAAEIELEALARAVGESAASKMAKQMAEESLSLMTVKELAGWTKFLDAERRHGRNALAATKKGDMAEAMLHKRRQLVSMHLARAAREKSEALEKTRKDLMSYLTSKGRRDKIARDYLDKIEALLDQYELRVSKQGPGTQRARLSAKQYVEQMIADGREAEIAPEAMLLAEMADAKVWRDLLAEEADYLAGTVKNLAHLGRTKNKLMKAQDKRRFDAVVAELVDTLVASPTTRPRAQSFTPTTVERIAKGLREFDARMTRLEFQLQKLDGRENGPLWNALFRPFADASDVETEMMRGAAGSMRNLYEAFSADERRQLFHRRVATPEIDAPGKGLTMMDIVVIGLNWGNEGNRKALIDGYGWDPAQVEAMLNRVLTDKHWDFIEGTWALIESYKAEAFALEKAITGVEPKAVAGVDFTLASGRVIKGKYYPLKYDGAQARADSVVISRLDEKQALSDLGKTFSKPMTKTGHLIERVGSGGKPVKINISVMHDHVQNVIHDIAYRRAVIDAHRMIRDPRFANAYIAAAGREQYDQLLPWLAAIATERNGDPGGIVTKIMQVGRRNMTVVAMGYKVGTALQQITGPIQGMTMIGPAYTAQGFVRALAGGPGSFWSAWKWVSAKSEFMRDRPQGFDRDMRMVTNRLKERTWLGPIQRNSMILTQLVDTASSTIVWIGAYQRALDGNVEGIAKGAEEDAIAFADSVVRQTQAAGKIQDLPQIMRGTEAEKLVTMMFSYFSGLYNLTRKQGSMTRFGQMSPMVFMANMALLFVVTPLFAAVLAGRFPPDDEDEEELGRAVGKELASNAAGTIPIFRDIVNASLNPQFGYQMSPVGSGIDRLTSAAARAGAGETLESEAAVKEAVNALGILFGLPTAQLVIMGDYANDLATGEEDPTEDPVDAAREALVRSNR